MDGAYGAAFWLEQQSAKRGLSFTVDRRLRVDRQFRGPDMDHPAGLTLFEGILWARRNHEKFVTRPQRAQAQPVVAG